MDAKEWYKKRKQEKAANGGSTKSSAGYSNAKDWYKARKVRKAYENGTLGDDINAFIGRVNTYSDNYNKYISDYNDRFVKSDYDGEEAADEYFYRTGDDAAQWAKSATDRKAQLEGESSAILSELEFYKPYVSEEWYNEIANYFNGHGDTIGSIVDVATKDNAYWSKWANEDEYKDSWYYSKFNKKYAGIDSLDGWEKAMSDAIGAAINDNGELSDEGAREIKYIQDRIDHYKARNYDGAAADAEITDLEGKREQVYNEIYYGMQTSNFQTVDEQNAYLNSLVTKYGLSDNGSVDRIAAKPLLEDYYKSLGQEIESKKATHQAKLGTQTYYVYEELRENEDFGELSKYDSSLFGDRTIDWGATAAAAFSDSARTLLPFLGLVVPEKGLEYDYSGLEYGFVNGDPDAAKWYQEEYYDDNHALGELIRGETEGYNLYTFLREDEKEMYNYLYKSQGEAAAHEYLEFLASDLESRKANERAQWFEDKPIAGTLYSIPAGIDQFASGMEGIFKDEYDPSVTSMTSQKIREDLADDGKILWYDFSAGSWREMKVFGRSGAQMVYDALSSGANMLPSILVSLAVEAAMPTVGEGAAVLAGLTGSQIAAGAGAVTMGASAMGNAKQEMLGMGYSVDQANAYGLMVGASEAGLSYLLSGIPGLRGGDGVFSALAEMAISKVDNALARAAITLGGDMLDEGLEEGLQTVLEGWFKEIATGVDFEDPSIDEILYSSLLGALTAAGFGGGKLAIDGVSKGINTGISAYNTAQKGKSYVSKGGVEGVGALAAQGLSLNQDTAAYKQASKVKANLDKGKSASNYSVGKLLSSMSESQTSTAVQTRLSAHIENKTEVRKFSDTITDILYGREVSDKALSSVAANKYALNTLNDVLGAKLSKNATVADVRAAVESYQETGGANASTNAKQGSTGKISGQSGATFSISENADGKFEVVAEADGESRALMSFKSQKQAQTAVYAMTLGMGAEGFGGLINLSENLPNGVDLGEAALAFNAIYNQGKNGKALSAAKNANLLSPEQRQYAYNLGIMDKALDGVRTKKAAAEPSEKNDGKVLQKDGVGDTIKENEYTERSTKYDETLVEEKTGAETGQGVDNTTRGDRENETGDTQMRAAVGQRPSISKRIRETTKGRQTLRRRLKRRLNTADKKYRALDCIIPKESSVAHHEQAVLDQYGVESYVIKNEAWKEPHIALTRNGIVYMREDIPESERGCVAEHEATHVMKQLRYQPYIDFLTRVGGMLDSSISDSDELTKRVADHAKVDINTPQDLLTLYDELNAMLFGGRHNVSDSTRNAFYDYDAYIQELTEIHEQYKREIRERAERHDTIREFLKDTVVINSLVFGNKESPVSINAAQSNTIFGLDLELDTVPFYKGTVYSTIEVDSSEDLDDFAEMYADGHIASFDIFLDGKKHKPSKDTDGYRIELEIFSNNGHDISLLEGFEGSDAVIFDRNSDFIIMGVQRTDKTLKIKLEDVSKGSWADDSNSQNNGNADPDVQQAKSDRASSSEWSAERIKDGKAKEAKPISEIIEQIRHDFGINVTKGHVRGKGVLGQYSRRDHGIRTKIANDLPTVSHELGHALDQRYGLTDKSKLTKEMKSELVNALGDLKGSYKQNLWVSEGFAEYIRRFLQNRDDAARAYPEFTKHFLNSLSKSDRLLIDTFADEINAYYSLDADTATSSIRLREEGVPDARTALEKAKEMGDGVYQAWVDANHGIRLFDEATGGDTYKLATNAAYSDAIAGQIITGDLTDANGQYVAPGLKSALEGVDIGNKQTYREFGEYLILRHGPERLNEGMMIFADPRKNTASFMAERQAKLEAAHPEFKEAADKLYEFQKQFLKTWAVDTGLLPSEVAEAWAERWSFYVPLNRAVGKAGTIGAKRGYANQNSAVRKAIGSGLDIVHPVDNIINNIVKMVNAGVRNNVMLEITAQAESLGADAMFLEKVPTPMKKKTADLTGVKAKLHDAFGAAGIEELLAEAKAESEYSYHKTFSEQIDDVVSGNHNPVYDLYVGKTPSVLIDIGFENKPLLMRNSKVKKILSDHPEMSIDLIKKIPDAISDPVMILKSKTNPSESVVVITDIITDKGHMIVPVWVSQDGTYLDVEIGKSITEKTNFVATAYGRNVKGLIEYALNHNEVLFYAEDKKRVSKLLATHGLQLPARLSISNSTISISRKSENVNKKFSTNSKNAKSDTWSKVDEIIESTIDDVLVQYGQGKAHGDVVTVLRNGKQEFWKINDALLIESLTSMSQKKMGGILEAYAVVSRFMTSNITGNNIIWSIFSNFPRDMMTFFTYSKQKNPLKAFPAMGEAYLNRVTGGKADTKNLPYIKEYHALGGGQTSAYTADVDLAKRARKKIKNSTKLQSAAYYANPLNLLSFVSETVESGPRIATYIMMREQGMSPQEAFYESQDITVNFKRGGRLSREFNKAVPFFNASVQGLDKFRRWITCADVPQATRAKAIVGRVTVYVAVSAALGALFYALNNWDEEDEENYRLLSNYTKNTYWNIPLGDGRYFAIPKPREIAVLSTFVETTCEYVGGNDYAYNEFGEYVADNFLPPFLSDLVTDGVDGALGSLGMIGVVSDLRANKDFLGRPIESTSLQGYETQDRYTRRTSMIAYWLGQAAAELGLDWSPVQIDYFFGQTLGGYWKVQKALFPVGSENVDLTLGVQNTYVKDNQYSNDIVNWLYDEADSSSKAKKSNPDDMDLAIDAKLDDNVKTFYSRYYALTKGQKEDSASRRAKRTVLDMIIEYRKATDNGDRSAAEKAVYNTVAACKDTSLLPAVMQSKVKDSQGKEYALTDVQYVEYQTIYEGEYWSYVEDHLGSAKNDAAKQSVLKNAKKIAKEKADKYALRVAKGNN